MSGRGSSENNLGTNRDCSVPNIGKLVKYLKRMLWVLKAYVLTDRLHELMGDYHLNKIRDVTNKTYMEMRNDAQRYRRAQRV